MGQYHVVCNLDKREYLMPHDLGDGLKLYEQGASSRGTLTALHMLLVVSNGRGGGDYPDGPEFYGRWAGDRIVVIGDYGEPSDIENILRPSDEFCGACLYAQASLEPEEYDDEPCTSCGRTVNGAGWRNVSMELAGAIEQAFGFTFTGDGWRSRSDEEHPPPMAPDMILGG